MKITLKDYVISAMSALWFCPAFAEYSKKYWRQSEGRAKEWERESKRMQVLSAYEKYLIFQ